MRHKLTEEYILEKGKTLNQDVKILKVENNGKWWLYLRCKIDNHENVQKEQGY